MSTDDDQIADSDAVRCLIATAIYLTLLAKGLLLYPEERARTAVDQADMLLATLGLRPGRS